MDALTPKGSDLFNSPLEAGIRAVTVLEMVRPLEMDLAEMVLLDHVLVHSADLGGPPSLHPDVPGRKGELLVRRSLVEASLNLMQRFHLIDRRVSDDGLAYRATDEAAAYVELLESDYSERLKTCAGWVRDEIGVGGKQAFLERVRSQLGEWTAAFIHPGSSAEGAV